MSGKWYSKYSSTVVCTVLRTSYYCKVQYSTGFGKLLYCTPLL